MGFFGSLGKKINEAGASMAAGQATQIPDMIRNYNQTNDDEIKAQIARTIGNIMRVLKSGATNGDRDCLRQYEQLKGRFQYEFEKIESKHNVNIIRG